MPKITEPTRIDLSDEAANDLCARYQAKIQANQNVLSKEADWAVKKVAANNAARRAGKGFGSEQELEEANLAVAAAWEALEEARRQDHAALEHYDALVVAEIDAAGYGSHEHSGHAASTLRGKIVLRPTGYQGRLPESVIDEP
jgi:hypothetical protein